MSRKSRKYQPKPGSQPSKPRYITIQLVGGSEDNPGAIHEGWYISIGGEVALVDKFGRALRDRDGRLYLQQVHPGENEIAIAKRLLRRQYYSMDRAGFGQPIRYPAALNNPA